MLSPIPPKPNLPFPLPPHPSRCRNSNSNANANNNTAAIDNEKKKTLSNNTDKQLPPIPALDSCSAAVSTTELLSKLDSLVLDLSPTITLDVDEEDKYGEAKEKLPASSSTPHTTIAQSTPLALDHEKSSSSSIPNIPSVAPPPALTPPMALSTVILECELQRKNSQIKHLTRKLELLMTSSSSSQSSSSFSSSSRAFTASGGGGGGGGETSDTTSTSSSSKKYLEYGPRQSSLPDVYWKAYEIVEKSQKSGALSRRRMDSLLQLDSLSSAPSSPPPSSSSSSSSTNTAASLLASSLHSPRYFSHHRHYQRQLHSLSPPPTITSTTNHSPNSSSSSIFLLAPHLRRTSISSFTSSPPPTSSLSRQSSIISTTSSSGKRSSTLHRSHSMSSIASSCTREVLQCYYSVDDCFYQQCVPTPLPSQPSVSIHRGGEVSTSSSFMPDLGKVLQIYPATTPTPPSCSSSSSSVNSKHRLFLESMEKRRKERHQRLHQQYTSSHISNSADIRSDNSSTTSQFLEIGCTENIVDAVAGESNGGGATIQVTTLPTSHLSTSCSSSSLSSSSLSCELSTLQQMGEFSCYEEVGGGGRGGRGVKDESTGKLLHISPSSFDAIGQPPKILGTETAKETAAETAATKQHSLKKRILGKLLVMKREQQQLEPQEQTPVSPAPPLSSHDDANPPSSKRRSHVFSSIFKRRYSQQTEAGGNQVVTIF